MKKVPQRRAPRPRGNSTPWIVLVDETPLRDEVLREHQRLEELAAGVRTKIEQFESADLPAYTRWEARVLGPLLTARREAEAGIHEKQGLLEEIEDEVFFQNCTRLAAYRRVMRRRARGAEEVDDEPLPGWEEPAHSDSGSSDTSNEFGLPPGFDAHDFDLLSPERQHAFREEYYFMAEMYEAMTGRPAPDLDELLRASRQGRRQEARSRERQGAHKPPPPGRGSSRKPEAPRPEARLKELYRLLVRKLHPDHNPTQTARDRELWHTVQKAYQDRDLETLEAAAARVEMGLNGSAGKMPISILRRLVGDLRKSLLALKSRLADLRKNPAFGFASLSPAALSKYETKHRHELERHLGNLQSFLAELTADLDHLAARAGKPKKKRAAKVELF